MKQLPEKYGTQQEKFVEAWLDKSGLRYTPQLKLGPYWADFYLEEIKTVIEADGVYGHFAKRDAKRDADLLSYPEVDKIWHIKAQKQKDIEQELQACLDALFEDTFE